jgi:2-oxoisovalerate dehydrogenase E2 component (dihydrolipoyl transacylase)
VKVCTRIISLPKKSTNVFVGIRECEIIQWFVEPEARVEEWDKLCEVQSDKASVEITSRFAGVIKKLHYDAGDMAKVGKPLLDIDIQSDISEKELEALTGSGTGADLQKPEDQSLSQSSANFLRGGIADNFEPSSSKGNAESTSTITPPSTPPKSKHANLATPAVRHLTKELKVEIIDVTGTGKDGRVLKEDVHEFARQRAAGSSPAKQTPVASAVQSAKQQETVAPLTNIQSQMFKSMTKSLSKPHFLYTDEIDFNQLSELRLRLNVGLKSAPIADIHKISYLPFIVKAMSLSMDRYPILNARVDIEPETGKPILIHRSHHNIGVAMDTPVGLLVPVIKNVSSLTILDIAAELSRLQLLASSGKLSTPDLSGGTITLSNIGSIGGTYVAPVIVEKELAILGMGKMRTIPAFGPDGQIVAKQVVNFSWSADHRVIDGATMARAAEVVRGFVENPNSMLLHLR